MKKYFLAGAFLLAALSLTGQSCLRNSSFFGLNPWYNPVDQMIMDNDSTFDMFEESDQMQDCDAIQKEFDEAVAANEDQSVIEEIVARHRACLAEQE